MPPGCWGLPLGGTGVVAARRQRDRAEMASDTVIRELADELWQADRTSAPIDPLTDRHPDLVIEDAYAIQSHNIQRRISAGAQVRGRKVGLTSLPMQRLLGVDEPDY